MAQHPREIAGYENKLSELAKAVGNLTYDQTTFFIECLAEDIQRQAGADLNRGREKLKELLKDIVDE